MGTYGRDFSANFKNGSQLYRCNGLLVDSHPIQHVWHMEWNLNEVILEEHNIFHNIFVQIVINF